MPERKCWSASALRSSGVARNAGECSHVQVSDEVTGFPKRCDADEAQRVADSDRHLEPFAIEHVRVTIAGQPCRRQTVVLDPESHALPRGPLVDRRKEALFEQLGERAAVVAPHLIGPIAAGELGDRQQRTQVVSTSPLETLETDRRSNRRRRPRGCRRTLSRSSRDRRLPAARRPPPADASRSRHGCSDRARSRRHPPPRASRPDRSGRQNTTARCADLHPAAAGSTRAGIPGAQDQESAAGEMMRARPPAASRAR